MECGAVLEIGKLMIPWHNMADGKKSKSKSSSRKAIYLALKIGAVVKDTECFVLQNGTPTVRFPDTVIFENVAPGFVCTIEIYGLDLAEKEKIKHLRYDAAFTLWGSLQLRQADMTGKLQNRSIRLAQKAPRGYQMFGTMEMKLSGAIPAFCETIREGFLNMWTEHDGPDWKHLWVILKNGKLKGGKDPRFESKNSVFQIEITNGLKISESTRRRANSFQLRDFNGRTILAAHSKDEMQDWIKTIRKHKDSLKRYHSQRVSHV